jgi:hypothetical protein
MVSSRGGGAGWRRQPKAGRVVRTERGGRRVALLLPDCAAASLAHTLAKPQQWLLLHSVRRSAG